MPGLTRVAIFVNTESANAPPQIKNAEEAARRLGIEVRPIVPIRSPGELEKAFEAATKAHASAAIRMIVSSRERRSPSCRWNALPSSP